ncbi:MAG: hypothetical protein AAGI38_14555 [Bacteroidota bacterium]
MNKSFGLIFLSILLLLTGCDPGNVDLDNAGAERLLVTISNVPYDMPPASYKRIQLDPGFHGLIIRNAEGEVIKDTTIEVGIGGLLNVANSNYIIWRDLYGNPELKATLLDEQTIEVGEQVFVGDFTSIPTNQVYVEQVWDYCLNDDFGELITAWEPNKDERYRVKSKLYREQDFVTDYMKLATPK